MNILFVCTGNTCRSPMAEALFKDKYPQASVQSAGIFAERNEPANSLTAKVLAQRGIEIDHRTRPVDTALLNWADLILTMTTSHKQALIMEYPEYQEKYFTLKEYVNSSDKEVWEELRKRYADLEDKHTSFTHKHVNRLDTGELNQKFQEVFKKELAHIEQLESELINYDLPDPFGGDIQVYEQTLEELDDCLDRLVGIISPNQTD